MVGYRAGDENVRTAEIAAEARDVLGEWRRQFQPSTAKSSRQRTPKGIRGKVVRARQAASDASAKVKSHSAIKPVVGLYRKWKNSRKATGSRTGSEYRVDETGPEFPPALMDRASVCLRGTLHGDAAGAFLNIPSTFLGETPRAARAPAASPRPLRTFAPRGTVILAPFGRYPPRAGRSTSSSSGRGPTE